MSTRVQGLTPALGALLFSLAAVNSSASQAQMVSAVRVASGIDRPVFATAPPADHDRLFVVEQHTGKIKIFDRNTGVLDHDNPFITIGPLATGNEQGLLGLAFHPAYASNGFFFTYRTGNGGASIVERYQVSADPDVANPTPRSILGIVQPQTNHNGGWLGFGPDGFLYITVGDGGGGNDKSAGHSEGTGNAQDITDNLLGKVLRIDVDVSDPLPYAIPASNPFVGVTGDDEIWAYGLRHPWRASFDRSTGDLYIGDVGQDTWEEIDFQPADSTGGENYGWRLREGFEATPTGGVGGAQPQGAVDPIHTYVHQPLETPSVTGGYVYRGPIAALRGRYFFADFASAQIWSIAADGSNLTDWTAAFAPDPHSIDSVSAFGEDADGNLYILELGRPNSGELFMLVPEASAVLTNTIALSTLGLLARRRRRQT